jgi:hypothetical protein
MKGWLAGLNLKTICGVHQKNKYKSCSSSKTHLGYKMLFAFSKVLLLSSFQRIQIAKCYKNCPCRRFWTRFKSPYTNLRSSSSSSSIKEMTTSTDYDDCGDIAQYIYVEVYMPKHARKKDILINIILTTTYTSLLVDYRYRTTIDCLWFSPFVMMRWLWVHIAYLFSINNKKKAQYLVPPTV